MGSTLGPVLSRIFMVELESDKIYTLSEHLSCWKRYVDDTIFFTNDSIDYIILILNSFHASIQYTYEPENNNSVSFLDIELLHVGKNNESRVFWKSTNSGSCNHWDSWLTPWQWKHSTLKTLVHRG